MTYQNPFLLDPASFRVLLEQVRQIMWVEDEEGLLLYSNRLSAHFGRKSLEGLLGLIHPEDHLSFRRHYENVRLLKTSFEIKCRFKSGEDYHWHVLRYGPFKGELAEER